MNTSVQKNRDAIGSEYKWNIEKMYPDESKWDTDLDDCLNAAEDFSKYRGHLADSAAAFLEALECYLSISRKFEHAFVYARMRHDEDNSNARYTEMNNRALSAGAKISAACSFFRPELLSADESLIRFYIKDNAALLPYQHLIDTIFREKAHVLSSEEENILAILEEELSAPSEAYTVLNNVDMDFGTCRDSKGEGTPITHANFINLMESEDRAVRKAAFTGVYEAYRKLNHTISVLYNYSVKNDVIAARIRRYGSALESALQAENIPVSVYTNLIGAVREFLPSMHRYVSIRRRVLGLGELKMYDVYCPLVRPANLTFTYDEAVDLACRALAPLGEDYVRVFRKGVTEDRWVDRLESTGKTSGAYSFGSYDSDPYILMNFTGTLKDVFTLVHEGGHSMHAWYTRREQPFVYGSHSIFTAEVASTVNETLLIRYLLENAETEEMKIYLINFYLDEFKSTLFRQTMFAEFEKAAHDVVEGGGSLTAEWLNREYGNLNAAYFGPDMDPDDLIQYEWSRIPHFYRDFYVYQYATGYSAANALAEAIFTGGAEARDAYRKFLTLGDSEDPIDLLKIAGVDMSTPEPVRAALRIFDGLVDQLDHLV